MPWAKLVKWLIFSVILALLPLAFNYLRLEMRGQDATLQALLGNGELLLVAAAISAAAIGEVIGSGKAYGAPKFLAGGGALMILALASMQFADVAAAQALPSYRPGVVVWASQFFFIFAVITGAGCVALSEK
jgi:hypothetical protein